MPGKKVVWHVLDCYLHWLKDKTEWKDTDVVFDISGTGKTSAEIVEALCGHGILAIGFGNLIRMVTHLDVSAEDCRVAGETIRDLLVAR